MQKLSRCLPARQATRPMHRVVTHLLRDLATLPDRLEGATAWPRPDAHPARRPSGRAIAHSWASEEGKQVQVGPGLPYPLGATWDGVGTNFGLFSERATGVELCL